MQRLWKQAVLFVSMISVLSILPGCGETVEDVVRVHPGYVTKSALEGEWYFRQTVVDRPPQFAYLFTGIEGALEKIRWEIRESQLIAYRSHPAVPGLEDDATLAGADYKGSPVAIYSITSHFDIVRDFNTSTGEQSNVLVPNTSLRPWYERDYMNVNWSTNTLSGPVQLGASLMAFPGTSHAQYREVEDDPYDPDRFRLEDDFIFLTTNYVTTDGGQSCYMGYGSGFFTWDNCGPVEVKIRSSFSKIDPVEYEQFEPVEYLDRHVMKNNEGEPLRYATVSVGEDRDTMVDVACTDEVLDALHPEVARQDCKELSWGHFNRFGYFRSERKGYDRRVGGGHDSTREFYANHHQMWKATKDENGDRIPFAQRDVRPVVYYLNPNFPEDLKAVAVKIGQNWNAAFTEAATSSTGKTAEEIAEQLRADDDGKGVFLEGDPLGAGAVFQVRENNCSTAGIDSYLARNASMVPVSFEATKGRGVLPGNLERVCSALHYFSRKEGIEVFEWQQMGDHRYSYVWWINEDQPNGPLGYGPSSADIETGRIISGNAHVYGGALDGYARSAADVVRALNGDLELADVIDGHSYLQWIEAGSSVADAPEEPTPEMQAEISRRIGSDQVPGRDKYMRPGGGMDKAEMMRHIGRRVSHPHPSDPLYTPLNTPVGYDEAILDSLKSDPIKRNLVVAPEMLQVLGPLYGWQPGDEVPDEMMDQAFDLTINPAAIQRREKERFKFFSENNVYLGEFLDDSIVGLALELKGLEPEEVYKRLREEIFEAVMLHEIGHTVGLRHNFKASTDALNYQDEFWQIREQYPEAEWNQARLPEYRYTSIMDYGARFNSDTKGLGRYDFAAIKYLYGERAEVFKEEVPVPGRLDLELEFADYTKIPNMLGGDTANLTKREDKDVRALMADKKAGVLENANLLAGNRDRPASDFWIDRTVPYSFCTDSYNGDLKCRTWDEGANETEAVQSAIQRYWNYYLFNSYRRGRNANSFINGFFGRQNRALSYLIRPWQYYYFYDAYPVDLRDDLLKASMLGLNFVNQVLGTPEPGKYCRFTQDLFLPASLFRRDFQRQCESVNVGIGAGRDQYLKFNDDHVYEIDYIGTFYDKMTMMQALAIQNTGFFKAVDHSDSRSFSIGYFKVFKEEVLKLNRDMMLGTMMNWTYIEGQPEFIQDSLYGPIVVDGELKPQLMVDPARFNTAQRATKASAPQVYTQMPFNVATRALLYGTLLNTDRWDEQTDFIEYVTIVEEGSGDDRILAEGTDVTRFEHPMTGQAYLAAQTQDGRSLGVELLQFANRYLEVEWEPARQAYETDPQNEEFARLYERNDRQLQDIVEMMDYLRDLRSMADFGNLQ